MRAYELVAPSLSQSYTFKFEKKFQIVKINVVQKVTREPPLTNAMEEGFVLVATASASGNCSCYI
jgi:hypothetical protein